MYTATSGFGVGLALVSANWIFAALAAMVIVGLAFRIPQEEKMLIGEFGEEYRAYVRRTGGLFPRSIRLI
jgi:protein-S-isoprenylcysteine O-methyltransferase Ste14